VKHDGRNSESVLARAVSFDGQWGEVRPQAKLSDYQRAEAIKRQAAGETLASIAKSYAVDLRNLAIVDAIIAG
jgi:hypothetical protein